MLYSLSNRLGLTDAALADPQLVGDQYFEAYAVAVDALAGLGHAPQPFADQPAYRGGFDLFFAVEALHQVRDAVEIEAAGDDGGSRAKRTYGSARAAAPGGRDRWW